MSVNLRVATAEESKTLTPLCQNYWQMTANTVALIREPDFVAGFSRVVSTDPYLPVYSTWIRGRHIALVTSRAAMKEVLKHHRSDPDGFFIYDRETYLKIINEIFPEHKLVLNDVILFCDKDHSPKYRELILRHLKSPSSEQIVELAEKEVATWEESVSLTRLNSFVSSVLSLILLGRTAPFKAIDTFSDGLIRRSLGSAGSDEYKSALKEIHDVIEETLISSETPFVQDLKESGFSEAQLRVMLFILFFAGQETTASALTYIVWDLARNPEKQEEIFQDLQTGGESVAAKKVGNYKTIQKIVAMGLFNHPPAAAFARLAATDLVMEFEDGTKRFIPEGRQVNACPIFAKDKEPNHTPTNYPFSYGPNSCPGQHLALMEMRLFLVALIKKFRFTTTQKEVKQVCRITLKLEPEVFIQLEKRT